MPGRTASSIRRMAADPCVAANSKQAIWSVSLTSRRPTAEVVVRCGDDPLLACGSHHAGRSAVFTSDYAPHWAPPEFLDWPGYRALWPNLIGWLTGAA